MDEHRYVLPSNVYPSPNSSDPARPRVPLTDSTGNVQYHTVASTNIHGDQKGLQPRPPSNFLVPTLPSQPARPPGRTSLEARKAQIRSQKIHRGSRTNPIAESKHYQDYRSRQIKGKDQKWTDLHEEIFLEALCLLPNMGRRKFSINGKPRGRNELIAHWLWLGYCESLPRGQSPDESQFRTRKQVSSHIQVLKGFLRSHPLFDRVFPPKKNPKNGFEDSFKDDPILRALAEGRLPQKPSRNPHLVHHLPQTLMPSLFNMWMTTLRPGVDFKDVPEGDTGDGKQSTKVHTYSDSVPRLVGYSTLEDLPNWRTRFPNLALIYLNNDLKCDVIHVEASLELRCGTLPERSELWGRFELILPGEQNCQSVWRCTQSLYKPADLYGPPSADCRFENITSSPIVNKYEPGVGTHIRINFPALSWAHALQRLSTLEAQFKEAVRTGASPPTLRTARQYVDQITMYQEIFCSDAPNRPFSRKAILLWTFKKCKPGEHGVATWRYLDPAPPRNSCFSPQPGHTHLASAAMNENFSAWAHDSKSQSLQVAHSMSQDPFDPLTSFDNLLTPSLESMVGSGDMQFHFPTYGYPSIPAEDPSLMSHDTQDSDSTLVGDVPNGTVGGDDGGEVDLDPFLSAVGVLSSFDQSGGGLWEASAAGAQNFENDPAFLAGYGAVPCSLGGQLWDAVAEMKDENWDVGDGGASHENWDVSDAGMLSFDTMARGNK